MIELLGLHNKMKRIRRRQDSNLRGQSPLDFESNALTTRPRLLRYRKDEGKGTQ